MVFQDKTNGSFGVREENAEKQGKYSLHARSYCGAKG